MRGTIVALLATHLAAGGIGYALAPTELLDEEVRQSGFFTTDTTKVLSTTVESLRNENKLLVFSYKGTARVRIDRNVLWIFNGAQQLIVPAVVPYYVDLSNLTLANVSYNDRAKLVTVRLPRLLLGDIAFQPENATTINGGLLTYSQRQVDELNRMNYASARRAMVMQAQQASLIQAAQAQAIKNVAIYFEIPLRIAGQPDVRVVATFR